MTLNILKSIPDRLLNARVEDLHDLLGGPTLIHLKNNEKKPIFISTLLHGNEHSGFLAVQELLVDLTENKKLNDYSLMIFIGNTLAAKENLRHLPDQVDFNRIWNGGDCHGCKVAEEVIEYVQDKNLLCSVDIHNNTGKNPFYSCINKNDNQYFFLANFFSQLVVYFTEPHEVQSIAFSKFCPSVTIEAMKSGDEEGVNILVSKLRSLLNLDEIPKKFKRENLDIYHTIARMKFNHNATFDFEFSPSSSQDFSFLTHIEELNFKELKRGEIIAHVNNPSSLRIVDDNSSDVFDSSFEVRNGKLIVKKSFIPAMFTKNEEIIRDDCFGYIMENFLG